MAEAITIWLLQLLGPQYKVVSMDAAAKTMTLVSGDKLEYESLISTMPLDLTLGWLGQQELADGLTHRSDPPLPYSTHMCLIGHL